MKKIYWIDDVRNPEDMMWSEWIKNRFGNDYSVEWCESYDEFIRLIDINGLPDIICFDHDLGDGKDGYDCCIYVVNYCMNLGIDIPDYAIQSSNPVGADNIRGLMDNYHKHWCSTQKG